MESADGLDQFGRAWLRCDLDELRGHLTPDAVYSPLSGELIRGRDAVVRRFAETFADECDSALRLERAQVSGPFGFCRWQLAGRTADGGAFAVAGVSVYALSGDLIRLKDVYRKA